MPDSVRHAFDFLRQTPPDPMPAVLALVGPDRFLKRLVLDQLTPKSEQQGDLLTLPGKTTAWRDLLDELSLVSLFGSGPRRVVLSEADDFVSEYRGQLEDYVQHPVSSGVLILDLTSLASNTRLYKGICRHGQIVACRLPEAERGRGVDAARVRQWLEAWATARHHIKLSRAATDELAELVGWELGLLDQELAKLALFVQPEGKVDGDLVRRVVGGWRTQTTWEMLDAAAAGDAGLALQMLDQLLQAGEPPQALFGSMAWSLRRFAAATRIYQRMEQSPGGGARLRTALQQAGFRAQPPTALKQAEEQLRQLTRQRAGQLFRWLLQTDLALKGTHSSPRRGRLALELLILRLARQDRANPTIPGTTRRSAEA